MSKHFFHMVLFPRWVRSEWAHVRPLDRFLCAIPASGVPPCQALCAGRLCSTRSGDGWSYTGWGGQGNAVCPQRGKTVLSPGMQVHTPADQLLSPVEGAADRETWRRCEIALPAHLHTEPQRRCVLSALLYVLPPHTDTQIQHVSVKAPRRRPGRSSSRGEKQRDPTPQIWAVSDGHYVQCGCSSTPAWFENLTVSRLRIQEDSISGWFNFYLFLKGLVLYIAYMQ